MHHRRVRGHDPRGAFSNLCTPCCARLDATPAGPQPATRRLRRKLFVVDGLIPGERDPTPGSKRAHRRWQTQPTSRPRRLELSAPTSRRCQFEFAPESATSVIAEARSSSRLAWRRERSLRTFGSSLFGDPRTPSDPCDVARSSSSPRVSPHSRSDSPSAR